MGKYGFFNEYTEPRILTPGKYHKAFIDNLCAGRNFDFEEEFVRLQGMDPSQAASICSECGFDESTAADACCERYRTLFDECLAGCLTKLKAGEHAAGSEKLAPFFQLGEIMMEEAGCGSLAPGFLWNLSAPLQGMLSKAFALLKRYHEKECRQGTVFEEWLLSDGYTLLFNEYPILFRLVCDHIQAAVRNLSKCSDRLRKDRRILMQELHIDSDQTIAKIYSAISDPHHGGETVIILVFADGTKLVYKPRNLGIDIFWNDFVRFVNDLFFEEVLKGIKTLPMEGYGYTEFIEYMPDMAEENLERYYYRCGILLAFAAMFGGSDFHYENLIVSGGYPVLADLETLMTPYAKKQYGTEQSNESGDVPDLNITRTLLLGKWAGKTMDGAVDIGAFTSVREGQKNYPVHENGTPACIDEFADSFLAGYTRAFRFIIDHREDLLSFAERIKDLSTRFVLRNTRVYYQLLSYFSNPAWLKNGNIYECVTFRVFSPYLLAFTEEQSKKVWKIAQEEHKALHDRNIPVFLAKGNSDHIYDMNGKILTAGFFSLSTYDLVVRNIAWHSEERLEKQCRVIRTILQLHRQQRSGGFHLTWSYTDRKREFFRDRNAGGYDLEKELHRIYAKIRSFCLDEDRYLFFAPAKSSLHGRYEIRTLDNSLYDGSGGICLFLGMYYRHFHMTEPFERLQQHILSLARTFLQDTSKLKFYDLSFTRGLSGFMQLLHHFYRMTERQEYLDILEKITDQLQWDHIDACKETDYFNGLCGLLYTLCRIELKNSKNTEVLIERTAERLLALTEKETGLWFDPRADYQPLTGLAHGQAGYALALAAAIGHVSPGLQERCRKQIDRILVYEDEQYSPEEKNLPDYRKFKVVIRSAASGHYVKRYMFGNCAGIIGSTLAFLRIQSYDGAGDPEIWIGRIREFLGTVDFVGSDSLCCGTAAWIDLLTEIGKAPEHQAWSRRLAEAIILSQLRGGYVFNAFSDIPDISLFKGLSGIGYAYLRFMDPYPDIVC